MNKVKYSLNKSGEFIIENYNFAKPFASFFPGIAGLYGIPMWVFYVNRGQGVISFGTEDKNHSIAEFLPANKAWQYTSSQGFRTFLKIKTDREVVYYEPFQDTVDNLSFDIKRKMKVRSYELVIEEINNTLGVGIEVKYFTLANEPIAGLVREVRITNLGKGALDFEVVDGLPQIVPYGTSNFFLKKMGRTIEAWMRVDFLRDSIPFYNLSVDPSDRPETSFIKGGNFYLAFINKNKKPKLLKTIVDPFCLFGSGDFSYPRSFINKLKFNPSTNKQIKESKTPCAFSFSNFTLLPEKSETIFSLIGYAHSKDKLKGVVNKILSNNFIFDKQKENKEIINEIEDNVWTKSGSLEFDLYARQTYLDNTLRGGYPVSFDTDKGKDVFYLYSRKHGDLERDYNNFVLAPTYFSQGNGNYRDMNQNRRSDNWFNLDVLESNIANFFNLIQTDGFNPLVVKGLSFLISPDEKRKLLKDVKRSIDAEKVSQVLSGSFSPGVLSMFIEDNNIELNISLQEFLQKTLSLSSAVEEADHCEGFWTDHWTYNLDLIESYLSLYPEKLKELLIDKKIFTFFDNLEAVRPRDEKYVLTDEGSMRQYHSVGRDIEKEALIANRTSNKYKARFNFGKGEIIYVNLLTKLICLFINKLASLDSFGVGIEMEANKPNWFDSLNGLPALFGSSINETFELKRLIFLIEGTLKSSGVFRRSDIILPVEMHDFLKILGKLLEEYFSSDDQARDFIFWDKAYSAKENYRKITKLGFHGKEAGIDLTGLFSILDAAERKVSLGIKRALDKKTNLYHTYFINEVIDYEKTDLGIKVRKFRQVPLPLFLEGQMHALRIERDREKAAVLYKATRASFLYDKKLKMYKVCASLQDAPIEIGRCRIFSPGWLENESIWLHMEYKFLFELLRSGLYDEFYRDFFNCFIPFLNPSQYGRSILENSSFLASSVFSDDNLHGTGFVARLSGSTAEFVSIWRTINTGFNPFGLNHEGNLTLRFEPILHKDLFTKEKTYSFKFLNRVVITYHASKSVNTFGSKGNSVKMYILKDEKDEIVNINSNIIPHPYAEKIRSGIIKKIDVYLA